MKVLYVVGSCLTKNTSANMSHNAYVQGLIENGCDVDIIMSKDSWGEHDNALPRWKNVKYHEFDSQSYADKVRKKATKSVLKISTVDNNGDSLQKNNNSINFKIAIRNILKQAFYFLFPEDPLYPLDRIWLKEANKFKNSIEYDLIISNSSPAASHRLVSDLLKSKSIKGRRWIQIWEDPWYLDLYGGHSVAMRDEEHLLLRGAGEIYYVSPLTLEYQKKYYSDCSHKMKHIPLPYLDFGKEEIIDNTDWSFGYFGDYYSHTRNLVPFYEALNKSGYQGYIYGDSDCCLNKTEAIEISGRVTLDILDKVQAKTKVLVHLCNLRGGQIPGKIYHYSATNKPILFILDGTKDEQKLIKAYFEKFNRFYFCENNIESIMETIKTICIEDKEWKPLNDFSPKEVVSQLL